MSIVSSGRSSVGTPSGSKVVRFQLDYNLKRLLLDSVNEKDKKLYEEFICRIRSLGQEIRDDDLVQLLKEARGCISILDRNFRLFVQVVLILQWTHRSHEVINEYQGFLQDLCSAHNYYTKLVIDHLISSFKYDSEEWVGGEPSEERQKCFERLHEVIKSIISIAPMSRDLLIASVLNSYPYIKRQAHEHEVYTYNVLQILQYLPTLRHDILNILISKLITLDVHTPLSELNATEMDVENIFEMEESDCSPGKSLDLAMVVMFNFFKKQCYPNGIFQLDCVRSLYGDFLKIFDAVILPTHSIHHVQFLMFYLIGLKPSLAISFLKHLWSKLTNVNVPLVIRQSAVCYIASLLARATYISAAYVQGMLSEISNWIHSYIANQDGAGSAPCQDMRIHGVFYATCQALFYVIAFRFRELVHNKGLALLQGLNLSKIVTCRLNPLKACVPVVVSHFASVARAYQLAYCYTIIERNSRSTLPQVYRDSTGAITTIANVHIETFFPFDPYQLPRSKSFVDPFYREYSEPHHDEETAANPPDKINDDEDDFLEPTSNTEQTILEHFSYSTSPGFLQF